jgi:hypothetical protein
MCRNGFKFRGLLYNQFLPRPAILPFSEPTSSGSKYIQHFFSLGQSSRSSFLCFIFEIAHGEHNRHSTVHETTRSYTWDHCRHCRRRLRPASRARGWHLPLHSPPKAGQIVVWHENSVPKKLAASCYRKIRAAANRQVYSYGPGVSLTDPQIPPVNPKLAHRSPFILPFKTVYQSPSLSQTMTCTTSMGHTRSHSESLASIKHWHNADIQILSPEQPTHSTTSPSYQSPQACVQLDCKHTSAVIPELDSKHASVTIPELNFTAIVSAPSDQGPSPLSNTPFVIDSFANEVQEMRVEEADKAPRMKGSAGGPG